MIVGLKESIPYVVQAIPEVTFDGEWLKMACCIDNLTVVGFCVQVVVTDNHSSNVNAFSKCLILILHFIFRTLLFLSKKRCFFFR